MGRQIVNTGGQGLASSQAAKAALGAIIVAVAILLIFFFLNKATQMAQTAFGGNSARLALSIPATR